MAVTTTLTSAKMSSGMAGQITSVNGSITIGSQALPSTGPTISYSNGTGSSAGQACKIATITGSVTASTPVSIDLYSLADASIINPISFSGIRAIRIQNTGTTAANILLIGDASGSTSNSWKFGQTTTTQLRLGASTSTQKSYIEIATWNNSDLAAISSTSRYLILDAVTGTTTYQVDVIGY